MPLDGLTSLYVGLLTDTGGFRHATSPRLFRVVAAILERGVDNNQLTDLDFLPSFPSLETLILDHNQLEELTNMPFHLKTLSMSHNKLKQINEADLEALLNLTHINLSFNQLRSSSMMKLKVDTLEEVLMSHNQLASVPPSLLNSTTIQSLDLAHNSIQSLPASWSGLPNLYVLRLSGNQISQVSNTTFATCDRNNIFCRP